MKYPCGLIRDLLPLYHDNACGEESRQVVQEHFGECIECKNYYDRLCQADFVESYAYDEAEERKKAEALKNMQRKLEKRKKRMIIAIIIGAIILTILPGLILVGVIAFLMVDSATSPIEEYTEVSAYETYIGEDALDDRFQNKWGMDEEIFPESITEDMQVEDFKMVYYNPWDAQYLSYLTVKYDEEAYQAEVDRLEQIQSTEYIGNYSVTGPPKEYALLAMHADDYQGFVYAITDEEDTIIYVELIFCNYFMDLDYTKYIPKEYLLEGFDATLNNPYEEQEMNKKRN